MNAKVADPKNRQVSRSKNIESYPINIKVH